MNSTETRFLRLFHSCTLALYRCILVWRFYVWYSRSRPNCFRVSAVGEAINVRTIDGVCCSRRTRKHVSHIARRAHLSPIRFPYRQVVRHLVIEALPRRDYNGLSLVVRYQCFGNDVPVYPGTMGYSLQLRNCVVIICCLTFHGFLTPGRSFKARSPFSPMHWGDP